LHQ
jgi:pimeloyl-ACP methyl ester carboxylesterase